MAEKVLVVVGAGPGLGLAVARRFGRSGYAASLVARDEETLARLGSELLDEGVPADWAAVDIVDCAALRDAIEETARRHGRIDVLHFNPSVFRMADPLHLQPADLLADMAVGVAALLPAVQAARPAMPPGSRVTVTGSMAADQPWHEACCLGMQKAALRNLVLSLDHTLEPAGVRAVCLTVNGTLAPGTAFSVARVADALYEAADRSDEEWSPEVAYDG